MNQQIRQLAEQAGMVKILEEHAHEYGNGTFENTPYPELEKFAELIVEECRYVMDCNKGSDQNPAWNQALSETSLKIKQHFGVEE